MSDRELIERAARSIGFGGPDARYTWTESEYPKGSGKNGALWNFEGFADTAELWNPLTDDGDAFRLAISLGLHVYGREIGGSVDDCIFVDEDDCLNDPVAATRRAIVIRAAQIGAG